MPTLKNLLKALVETRVTPAEAVHACAPSGDYVVLKTGITQGNSWADLYAGYASVDGRIWFCGSSTSTDGNALLSGYHDGEKLSLSLAAPHTATLSGYIPVKKGDHFTIGGQCMRNLKIYLLPSVGGGKHNCFKGGILIWLPLNSCLVLFYLPSSIQRKITLKRNHCLNRDTLMYLLEQQMTTGMSMLHAMDILFLQLGRYKDVLCGQKNWDSLQELSGHSKIMTIDVHSPAKKEISSGLDMVDMMLIHGLPPTETSNSYKRVRFDDLFGGAL